MMKIKEVASKTLLIFGLFACSGSLFAQDNKLDLYLSGGIHIPTMGDVNNIYQRDLVGYDDVNMAYDFSTGFALNFRQGFSIKVGFNYLLHKQNPPVELIEADGDTVEGKISYKIQAYCPFVGVSYNKTITDNYRFSIGLDVIPFKAKLTDELPDADTFFDYLHGSSLGFAVESNIRRIISEQIDVGLDLGYRFLTVNEAEIDASKYPSESKDIVFTLNGETVDLDFSGPFIRLSFIFKL
jgi:hypothetical protein